MTIILTLNSGSSSLKFGLHRVDGAGLETLLADSVSPSQQDAIPQISKALAAAKLPAPQAIGHRIVHGGAALRQHRLIDADVMQQLEAATPFAPLHTPAALALIRSAQQHWPSLRQVACFDTSFHRTLPAVARVLPIDRTLQAQGIERYGFHGLSCESIVQQLGSSVPARLVIAHLGHGASITAVRDGLSIDTSMGLTPSGGAMMGTRSGDLDPGLLIYLLLQKHCDVFGLEELINHRSGLLGVSGITSDMRLLHHAAASNGDARLAIAMFCMSVKKQVAAMAAVLGGLDLLVFTGGIGEHDALVRDEICKGLDWLACATSESRSLTQAAVRVLPSQEDVQIARHSAGLCGET
ncbi:MAG: acetate kinase [Pseudomonadota bacterium]